MLDLRTIARGYTGLPFAPRLAAR
ncbi:MAG: hypothetical protein JWN21_503, partial [Sphingomonas bacterium]|nr:hypothetical protein [Sphingomonas bacterium]